MRQAVFVVTGEEDAVLRSDADPVIDFISIDLPVGDYSIVLESGWQFIRDGAAIAATLASEAEQPFTIYSGQTTNIVYRFAVGEDVIAIGGDLQVHIEIDEPGEPEDHPVVCEDGIDNDLDGSVDCDDPDCYDTDADACYDCASGVFDPANDGADTDGDGICDLGDPDDDGDGVPDTDDADPYNPYVCRDDDADTCDDCSVTGGPPDVNNDGPDTDGDGICDAIGG